MIRLLVADDHALVRSGIKHTVQMTKDIVVADEARNGQEVLEKVRKSDIDVVLLDISMPGRDGLDILKELRTRKPSPAVLILSIYPEELYAVRAIRSGAAGYLTKDSAPDELIAAIRRVSEGGKYVTASLAEKLAASLGSPEAGQQHDLLSDREYQIMCMIASGKTPTQIAGELSLSIKTISTYRARILAKMNMKNNAEITRYAIENKLV